MKRLVVPMELKKVSAAGEFSGYASIFDNLDLGYDVIEKGAFQEIVKTPEGKVLTLFQHDAQGYTASGGLPIGLSDVEQDDKGLHFDSKLIMEDPFVQRVHTHLKAKTLNGMSIGFDVLPGGAEYTEAGVRRLKALKLWEISVVTFGMNPKARVEAVKHAAAAMTIREFEDLLRDECGFSNAQAKLIAAGGFKALQKARDEHGKVEGERMAAGLLSLPVPNFSQ
jgi:HK97 family phage prohead protease